MFDRSTELGVEGLSTPVGVSLLFAIVVVLAALLAVMATDVAQSTTRDAQVHATGAFDIDFEEGGNDSLRIEPVSVRNEDTTFRLEVNDYRVHTWNGLEPLDFTCLYPGDHIEIVSREGDTTFTVRSYRVKRGLACERIRPLPQKFEYAYINTTSAMKKVRVQPEYVFNIEIDPDGPGRDSTMGHSVAKRNIGTIPVTNQWHYIRKYDKPIEGFSPPVWVIVMTDNVHWSGVGGGLNWTDDPSFTPGIDSYSIQSTGSGNSLKLEPSGSEPTNDIYMVFKPGCSGSKLKVVDVSAGYHNRIYVNGKVAIRDTYTYSRYNPSATSTPVTISAPAVNCPTSP